MTVSTERLQIDFLDFWRCAKDALKGAQRVEDLLWLDVFHDEDDLGIARFVIAPVGQMLRRMDDMLYAVEHDWPLLAYVDDAFDAEHILAVFLQQEAHPDAEGQPVERFVELDGHGADIRRVCALAGFGRQTARRFVAYKRRAWREEVSVDISVRGGEDLSGGIELGDALTQPIHGFRIDEIGLGDDDFVGGDDLLDRFRIAAQVKFSVGAVEAGRDQLDIVVVHQAGMREDGKEDGRGVGKSCRFDDHAVKRQFAGLVGIEHFLQLADQIVAAVAADTAAGEQRRPLLDAPQQAMVEPGLPVFIDDDTGASKFFLAQDVAEHCRFAAAQKAGEDGDGTFVFSAHSCFLLKSAGMRAASGREDQACCWSSSELRSTCRRDRARLFARPFCRRGGICCRSNRQGAVRRRRESGWRSRPGAGGRASGRAGGCRRRLCRRKLYRVFAGPSNERSSRARRIKCT